MSFHLSAVRTLAAYNAFEGHGEISLGRLCVAGSRLIRMRCTVAIKPEAKRQIYWTKVSINTLVSISAANDCPLEKLAAI